MRNLRILVVEDDTFVAIGLEHLIDESVRAEVVVAPTNAVAERELIRPNVNFAFLDVNLMDGKSYRVADILLDYGIPFAFVSGNNRDRDMPPRMRHIAFLQKPYKPEVVTSMLRKLQREAMATH
jgi:DNA-binding LytR/AlgR family response regulator